MDNYLNALKYYEFVLYRHCLDDLPVYPLPDGYQFVFYTDGDRDEWIRIESSAQEFICYEDGLAAWERYYGGKETQLKERMLFVVNPAGKKVATATAFYEPQDKSGAGWLHWVAVCREEQGKGLAKPLVSKTLSLLSQLGYRDAKIPTQTTSWVAVKVYLDFGFTPLPDNAQHSFEGYRIVRTLTNHPSLSTFPPMPREEMWDPVVVSVQNQLKSLYPDITQIKVWQGGSRNKVCFLQGGKLHKGEYTVDADQSVTVTVP